jgi:hypothetical protein
MDQVLEALSPWAEVDASNWTGLSPRLDTLNGKTIGMFADFMNLSLYMLQAVEAELKRKYPEAKFSYFQYEKDPIRIPEDTEWRPRIDAWLDQVDAVLYFYGSVPSSSLFIGYNSAYMEKQGKPTAMLVNRRTYSAGVRGVRGFGVPGLRISQFDMKPEYIFGGGTLESITADMAPDIEALAAELAGSLINPLSEEEAHPTLPDQSLATDKIVGTVREIQQTFYRNGWTNGAPIEIPTREAVDEMLQGTDLAPDTVIAYLPPKMGAATVEKIAVNAVMAGCLPTYMPILIAAVKGVLAPNICLEGWTCSQSTWGPALNISGKIVNDIGLNTDGNFLSPYYKPNATIARAYAYLMLNVAGLRPGIEDLSEFGHENRLGLVIGDSWDNNPWGPIHEDFGLDKDDNAVTMFWPQEHRVLCSGTLENFLDDLCKIIPYGWDPGMEILLSPICAKMFADAGWTKQRIKDYIVEYARRPASEVDIQWLVGNNHPPKTVDVPVKGTHSTRIFWSDEHMLVAVGGGRAGKLITVLGGGGDHGGPSCTKIELPKNWDALVEKYRDVKPYYINY